MSLLSSQEFAVAGFRRCRLEADAHPIVLRSSGAGDMIRKEGGKGGFSSNWKQGRFQNHPLWVLIKYTGCTNNKPSEF